MRRGELLALRWRHIDLEAGTISVRRSVGVVRIKGEGVVVKEGDTKTAKPRVVDLDSATVALLRAYKRKRDGMALQLARDDALVLGGQEGDHRHPERFSRGFQDQLGRCARAFEKAGREALPRIRVTTSAAPTPRSSWAADRMHSIGGMVRLLDQAGPLHKAQLYGKLGLRLTYHPSKRKVLVSSISDQDPIGESSVSEGGLEPPCPAKGTSTSS